MYSLLPTQMGQTRIYVGNIVPHITEDDLKQIFSVYGTIKSTLMPTDKAGQHKGYLFVEYHDKNAAEKAVVEMDKFELGGKCLKVGWSSLNAPPLESDMMMGMPEQQAPAAPVVASVKPSRILMLTNMVTPKEVDNDLKDEVAEECSKFGTVERMYMPVHGLYVRRRYSPNGITISSL